MRRTLFYLSVLTLLFGALSVQADRIRATTVACADVKTLEKLEHLGGDFKDKNLFILRHGCVVLTPKDKIHVLAPDNTCCGLYYRIQVDATDDIMYVKKFSVQVEQAGTGNVFRF